MITSQLLNFFYMGIERKREREKKIIREVEETERKKEIKKNLYKEE